MCSTGESGDGEATSESSVGDASGPKADLVVAVLRDLAMEIERFRREPVQDGEDPTRAAGAVVVLDMVKARIRDIENSSGANVAVDDALVERAAEWLHSWIGDQSGTLWERCTPARKTKMRALARGVVNILRYGHSDAVLVVSEGVAMSDDARTDAVFWKAIQDGYGYEEAQARQRAADDKKRREAER